MPRYDFGNRNFESCTSLKKKLAILHLKGCSMLNEITMPSLLKITRRNINQRSNSN